MEVEASKAGFEHIEVRMWESQPHYLVFNTVPFTIGVGYERLVNRFQVLSTLRAGILARLVK